MNPTEPIPYVLAAYHPGHGLRTYRYQCTVCRTTADYMLPPSTNTVGQWLPKVGTNPVECHLCHSRRCLKMTNRANVKRRNRK